MEFDPVLLSRIQFALNISFHILFPTISIGLAYFLLFTAFFLEASFLGIMLFGKSRVSNRVHLLSTTMVALGTTLSAFWILSLNSWMQTPSGFSVQDGVMFADD